MKLFDHPLINQYEFEQAPLGQDIFLMDEKWMAELEAEMIATFSNQGTAHPAGTYSAAAARSVSEEKLELSWYLNRHDRVHWVDISMPRSAFVRCVGCWRYDYKPIISVRGDWLTNLHLRSYSVFAQVDAIGVKSALSAGTLSRARLAELRRKIDEIARCNPGIAFISFADSMLLKSNYTVGQFKSSVRNTYEPEKIIRLLPEIRQAYQGILGLDIYCIATQGQNEYSQDDLLHIGGNGNHISLNSLGIPFAQLQSIDQSVRNAIRNGLHPPSDVYLDESFFHSLRFEYSFNASAQSKFTYRAPMRTEPGRYATLSFS